MFKVKVLYKCFVKVLNKATLKDRSDTVWREKLGLDDEVNLFGWFYINHQLKNAQVIFSGEFYMVQLL